MFLVNKLISSVNLQLFFRGMVFSMMAWIAIGATFYDDLCVFIIDYAV